MSYRFILKHIKDESYWSCRTCFSQLTGTSSCKHTENIKSPSEIFNTWILKLSLADYTTMMGCHFLCINRFICSVVNPKGFWRAITQRIYVPINTNFGRGQRSKVTGLRCNDPSTAGNSLYRNVILSAVWPLFYGPSPPPCCHCMRREATISSDYFRQCFSFSNNKV